MKLKAQISCFFLMVCVAMPAQTNDDCENRILQDSRQYEETKKQFGDDNNMTCAVLLANMAVDYAYLGDYTKAIELGTKGANICKLLLGENHLKYATCLCNLSDFHTEIKEYEKAIDLRALAMNILRQHDGQSLKYATLLVEMASDYDHLGDYTKAVEFGLRAIECFKENLDDDKLDYASSLNQVSVYCSHSGDYPNAIDLVEQAIAIVEQELGVNSSIYADCLNNLSGYYSELFNYPKAIELGEQSLEIRKQIYGESSFEYGLSLSNLSLFYSGLGNHKKAIEFCTVAMRVFEGIFNKKEVNYARCLAGIAECYSRLSKYDLALEGSVSALAIFKQELGEKHPLYALNLRNLASYYSCLGDNIKALQFAYQAYNIFKQNLGKEHPYTISTLYFLSKYSVLTGDEVKGVEFLLEGAHNSKEKLLSMFQGLTSKSRQTYWNWMENKIPFLYLPILCVKTQKTDLMGEVYDNSALFTKGLLLNAETSLRDLILESGDSAAVKQFDTMQMIRMTLNKQYEKPIADRKLNCDSLERVADQMERELMKSSKAFGDFTRSLTVGWKDVQKGLGDDDVAIEFLASPVFGGDSILYVALTLKKGYDKPKMITLFEERELRMVRESKWYTTPALCELVWGPLTDELKGVKNVYFSPSGALYNIGIEQLPCSATENIGERYNMFRLSSTRELALRYDKPSEKSSALYGGLRYYVPPTELLAYNRAKGYSCSSSSRDVFERLPETKTEIDNITALLRAHSYGEPAVYEGDEGTEESFKALSGKRTSIIHLATHGSYITPTAAEKQRKRDMMKRLTFLRSGDDRQSSEEDETLTRSFLVMSGGKMLWTSDSIPEGVDDGLLTAQEISRLDLRGCDLAVLSACETGLGDISSEGVMGLQRGFKKAGVRSIVMSLWKVADRPTQEFMTEFYRHLTAGEGKRASFLAGQRFLQEKYPTNLPQDEARPPYWASFILLDPEVR